MLNGPVKREVPDAELSQLPREHFASVKADVVPAVFQAFGDSRHGIEVPRDCLAGQQNLHTIAP